MRYEEEKAEEYVSRNFPNADFGYCGCQSERYKAAFMAGYEQCKKDMGWQYPSKGELPKKCYEGATAVLLAIKKEPCNRSVISETEISLGFFNGEFRTTGFITNIVKNNDVIAWQYIEPPKEGV